MSAIFTPDEQQPSAAFTPDPGPTWGEALSSIPTVYKSNLQQAIGGWTQMLGDITNRLWGDESVRDVGKGIAESGKINADLGVPKNMSFPQQSVVQGGASVLTSATFLPLGPVAGTAALGGVQAGGTYDEARSAGLGPGRSFAHAAFEGTVEALTEYLPAKALFGQHKNILAKTLAVLSREYPGEVLATVLQDASAKVGYRPDMTAKDFLDDMLLTLGATTVSAPLMAAGAHGIQRAMRRETPTPPTDPNKSTPPVYPNAGVEVQESAAGVDTTQGTELFGPPKPSDYVYPKTSIQEPTVLDAEGYARAYYERLQQKVASGEIITGTDALWMKWYEQGTVTERPFSPPATPQPNPVEDATATLSAAAATRDPNALILPTSLVQVQQSSVAPVPPAPAPQPSVILPATSTPVVTESTVEPKSEVVETKAVPVAEVKGGTLPGAVQDVTEPKSFFDMSDKMTVDSFQVVRNGPDAFTWTATMGVPRGGTYEVGTGIVKDTDLANLVGKEVADQLIEQSKKQGVATAHDSQVAAQNIHRPELVKKVGMVRQAQQQYGKTITGALPERSSVPNVVPASDAGITLYTKMDAAAKRSESAGQHNPANVKAGVSVVNDTGELTAADVKLTAVLQRWAKKYVPDARIVLVRGGRAIGGPGALGAMMATADGVYYIQVREGGTIHQQMTTLAHEFGHVLITDQFYKSSPAEQKALFDEYHQFLRDFGTMTLDQYMAQRFGPDTFLLGQPSGRAGKVDTPAKHVMNLDGRSFQGYTLSFDEYYADQFVKYALSEGEFDVNPTTRSIMERAYARVKEFFTDFGKFFAPGQGFKTWVKGLASNREPAESAKPVLSQDELKTQKKLIAALKKAGFDNDSIDALKDDAGLLNEAQVYEVLGEPVKKVKAPNDLDFTDLEQSWPGAVEQVAALAEVEPSIGDSVTRFNWWIGKFASLLQISKLNAHVPGVSQFTDGMRRMFATKSHWTGAADARIKAWRELGKEQSDKLSKVLLEEARSGKYVGTVVQNSTNSRDQTFTIEFEEAQRRGLNDAAVKLYSEIHGDYLNALNAMELRAIEELWRVYSPEDYYNYVRSGGTSEGLMLMGPTHPLLAQHVANTQKSFAELRQNPYLPFTRFGRNAVLVKAKDTVTYQGKTYKAGETVYFAAFETTKERNEDLKRIKSEMEFFPVVTSGVYIKDEEYNMRGLPPALANALKVRLELNETQVNDLNDLLASMTSSQAFVRHLQKRKGVAGYSEDVMRVYGDYFLRFSNYMARLQHGHELDNALDEVAKSAKGIVDAGGVSDKRDMLHEWLFNLRDYVMKPQSELEDIRGALTVTYLMYNVKSALVNGFQVPFVTVPYLSSRYSWGKSFATTQKSYKDILRSWREPKALSDEEWSMMQRGLSDGFLDESFASALANTAEGGNLLRALPVGRIGKGWEWVKTNGMVMFQRMEEINRRVTFMAAYRLARAEGKTEEAAYLEARTAIETTQNEYAKWNRPEFMRGPIKSLMFMFMQYQQNMIFQMYGGDKAWARLLGVHLAMAGLMGLPFMGNLRDLIKWFGKLFGENWDLEMEAREFIKDVGVNPDWVMNGAGHNFFGVDLSGSLSMGRPIPGTEALANEGRFPERMLNASQDIGGAGIGYALNVMQAIADDNPDTFKRVQRAMPVFLQNAMKGIDEFEQGGRVDRTGALVSEVSPTEAVIHGALGFNPAQAAAESREFHAKKQLSQYWLTRRSVLLSQYFYASEIVKDREAAADVRQAIRDFNSEAPDRDLAITSSDLQQSVKARLRVQHAHAQGSPLGRKTQGLTARVEELYQTDQ